MNNCKIFVPVILSLVLAACTQKQTKEKEQGMPDDHKPFIHFTPPGQWMNDPNGLVYEDSTWHLFYQHHPSSLVWGPMHWGHATSRDLAQWNHEDIALRPDSLGMVFSGSAVLDQLNSSNLGTKENPPLIAIFTQHDADGEKAGRTDFQNQSLAFSLDHGQTWVMYKDNPVIRNTTGIKDFRDPKVFFDERDKKWKLVLAAADHIRLFESSDLIHWKYLSEFGKNQGDHGGVWECPDLFPMKDPLTGEDTWVLLVSIGKGGPAGGSATQYFTGMFNGRAFEPDSSSRKVRWMDYGPDNYAGVTYSGTSQLNRRILIGWMSNWEYAQIVPATTWRSSMTIPRDLSLAPTHIGNRLASVPILPPAESEKAFYIGTDTIQLPVEIEANFLKTNDSARFELVLSNPKSEEIAIGFDGKSFYSDRTKAGDASFYPAFARRHTMPRFSETYEIPIRIVVDRTSVEIFADNGLSVLTQIYFPSAEMDRLKVNTEGPMKLVSGRVRHLPRLPVHPKASH